MGAWGYGFLDNDPALDIKEVWATMLDAGHDHVDVTNRCFSRWGDAIAYGDSITNHEVLALMALHLQGGIKPSKKLVKVAVDAVNRELTDEALGLWEQPERRKESLLSLLRQLGGKAKEPARAKGIKDPAIYYENLETAQSELLRLVREAEGRPWMTYEMVRELKPKIDGAQRVAIPPFIEILNRFMKHRLWEKDNKIVDHARVERLMMLATYLGVWLRLSEEEVKDLLKRCNIFEIE